MDILGISWEKPTFQRIERLSPKQTTAIFQDCAKYAKNTYYEHFI